MKQEINVKEHVVAAFFDDNGDVVDMLIFKQSVPMGKIKKKVHAVSKRCGYDDLRLAIIRKEESLIKFVEGLEN